MAQLIKQCYTNIRAWIQITRTHTKGHQMWRTPVVLTLGKQRWITESIWLARLPDSSEIRVQWETCYNQQCREWLRKIPNFILILYIVIPVHRCTNTQTHLQMYMWTQMHIIDTYMKKYESKKSNKKVNWRNAFVLTPALSLSYTRAESTTEERDKWIL